MSHQMREILPGYTYQTIFNGEIGAGFMDCMGLESVAFSNPTRKVILHTGVIVTHAFFDWVMEHSAPQHLRVVQLAESGLEMQGWELLAARVSKVTATTFTGSGFPFRVEALELNVEKVVVSEKP